MKVQMTEPEKESYLQLINDNIAVEIVAGKEMTRILANVHRQFPDIWDIYYMNCRYVGDKSRQFVIQYDSIEDRKRVLESLPNLLGPIFAAEEPNGTTKKLGCLFSFSNMRLAGKFALSYSRHCSLFDASGSFLIVKNSHSQIIGNGLAAHWLSKVLQANKLAE